MKIKHITIENFKGIKSFNMDLGSKINIFIGSNGSGKSTVIEAINMLLSWVEARVRNEKGSGDYIHPRQIRKGVQYARLAIILELEGIEYSWSLYKKANKVRKKLDNDSSNLTGSRDCANHIARILNEGKIAPPIITLFGVNRAVDEIPKGISAKKHKLAPKDIYEKMLQVGFRSLFEWMLERQNIENEEYRRAKEAGEVFSEDRQLTTVKTTIERIFLGKYSNLKVRSNPRRITIDKRESSGSEEYELDQLSDGEKCYLAVAASIARLLAMSTPSDQDPFSSGGIVLIDEIDLHLHPEWQLSIVPQLVDVFSNCQFILTTHSPHVISSIPRDKTSKLISMEQGQGTDVHDEWYGKKSDAILLSLFGLTHVRNNEISELIEKIWKELNQGNITSDAYIKNKSKITSLLDPNDVALFEIQLQEALIAKQRDEKDK